MIATARMLMPGHVLAAALLSVGVYSISACSEGRSDTFADGGKPWPQIDAPVQADAPLQSSPTDALITYVTAGPQPAPGTLAVELIGNLGGMVSLGDLRLTVPAGIVSQAENIIVAAETPSPDLLEVPTYSSVYRFGPEGLSFQRPIEVRIPFSGSPELATVMWSRRGEPTVFDPLPTTIDGAFAVAQVSHFSKGFVAAAFVLAPAKPCAAAVDCFKYYDGNLCHGLWMCSAGQCKIDPSTVVTCAPDPASPCDPIACNPDKGKCEPGPYVENAWCDDGIPCTTGEHCTAGKCTGGINKCGCLVNADCAPKEDGNKCNGTLYCDKEQSPYVCLVNPASIVTCWTGEDTACAKNQCKPTSGICGVVNVPDGTICNDGNMCTAVDTCQSGKCVGIGKACECESDADCAVKEDGNLCNGTLWCNKVLGKCLLNPNTVVTCPTVDDTFCIHNACMPVTGKCVMTAINEGTACDDGNPCTTGEACTKGKCASGNWTCECNLDADCAQKNAGKLCDGNYLCNHATGKCVLNPATAIACSTGGDTQCLKNTCNNTTGTCKMIPVADGTPCSDGDDYCTLNDSCQAGVCKGGPYQCECQKDIDCAVKEDGDLCNGTLYCAKDTGKCIVNPATVVSCPTVNNTTCSETRCVAASGQCQAFSNHDGKECTTGAGGLGECSTGACAAKSIGTGRYPCTTTADCAQYTGGNKCVPMVCHPIDKVCNRVQGASCSSVADTECAYNACNPSTGACVLVPRFEGTSCGGGTGICASGDCL